jgi:hypothetical protein
MLSVNLLDRLIQHRDYDRLLQSLADNGMVMPLGLGSGCRKARPPPWPWRCAGWWS